jgi:hypothetical protein
MNPSQLGDLNPALVERPAFAYADSAAAVEVVAALVVDEPGGAKPGMPPRAEPPAADVTRALFGADLAEELGRIRPGLRTMWVGALERVTERGTDSTCQALVSMRELLLTVIRHLAPGARRQSPPRWTP